jgi:hypothetical protein
VMNFGWEAVAIVAVVVAAGTWAVRALARALKKPGGCSSCAGSGACPLIKGMGNDRTPADCSPERDRHSGAPRGVRTISSN